MLTAVALARLARTGAARAMPEPGLNSTRSSLRCARTRARRRGRRASTSWHRRCRSGVVQQSKTLERSPGGQRQRARAGHATLQLPLPPPILASHARCRHSHGALAGLCSNRTYT
jgi:hypothetical protein